MKIKVIIMGAAGRDFHNFNIFFRDKNEYEVIAFTATQIPNIEKRTYPKVLAGKLYPKGIPIYPEFKLTELIKKFKVDKVVFAYSDVSFEYVMHKASEVLAAGSDFWLLGPKFTQLKTHIPVISVCATRTGAGKSQTVRKIVKILMDRGKRVVSIRHPMPYGDLTRQVVERYESLGDLDKYNCTIEEREEYEPYIAMGAVVFAGVDYIKILKQAEKEAEVIVWDGGNNDFSFFKPKLQIVVTDALRAGDEVLYHPGETNLRMADVLIINKENSAKNKDILKIKKNIEALNPKAKVIDADSVISGSDPDQIKGKRVLVVEDGPTLTHGGMNIGAGFIAAKRFKAKEIISPLKYTVGSIKEVYKKYPQTKLVLPAMGYSKEQIKELEATINNTPAEVVIIGTPIDLSRVVKINKPFIRVRYELEEKTKPDLANLINRVLKLSTA